MDVAFVIFSLKNTAAAAMLLAAATTTAITVLLLLDSHCQFAVTYANIPSLHACRENLNNNYLEFFFEKSKVLIILCSI